MQNRKNTHIEVHLLRNTPFRIIFPGGWSLKEMAFLLQSTFNFFLKMLQSSNEKKEKQLSVHH